MRRFFFSSRRRHTRCGRDWSSDVCSSDLYSIDLVAYDLQNMRVGHALANASRRGVRVRVITDVIHRDHAPRFTHPMWDTLRAAGIYNIDDSGTIYHPDGKIGRASCKEGV